MPKERAFKLPVPSEKVIQSGILSYLALTDVLAKRNNAGKLRINDGVHRNRMVNLGESGWPDIIGLLGRSYGAKAGHFLGVEVKKPGNKTTPLQDSVLARIEEYGGITIVAYSIEDVQKVLEPLRT